MALNKSILLLVIACVITIKAQSPCITACTGLEDGPYQSCTGCDVYSVCVGEILYDKVPCVGGYVWDDSYKHCQPTSETCTPPTPTCVTSCSGRDDGDYPSCNGDHLYATCVSGFIVDNRPCPGGLVFNAGKQKCDYSRTD